MSVNRHIVIRITVDARAVAQRERLIAEITDVISEHESAEIDSFPTVVDWDWTVERD